MNIDKKTCINIGIVAFLLYLAIHYWDGLVGLPWFVQMTGRTSALFWTNWLRRDG